MNVHSLKTTPGFFQAVRDGRKNFEVRKNDRGFRSGDLLVLREYGPLDDRDPNTKIGYTGAVVVRQVTYVLTETAHPGVSPNFVVMGLIEPSIPVLACGVSVLTAPSDAPT